MKVKNIFISTGLVLSAVLGVSSNAQAASFTTNFTPNPFNPATDSTKDITLQSIEQNGFTTDDFILVKTAKINKNTNLTLGPASTDKGLDATSPGFDPKEKPTNEQLAAYLGNTNLNNIVDGEESGEFDIDVFFDKVVASNDLGLDSIFVWERGANSDIQLQALDASGNPFGVAYKLTRNLFASNLAGYSIKTTEIATSAAQPVGAYGVSFQNLGLASTDLIYGLKLTAGAGFNGPDFKVAGANFIPVVDVPEPTTMLGLGSVAALALLRRRQTKKTAC
ncbi:MAG: exosortase-dependent surface protein XDP2 [Trichormus sp.]